MLLTRIKWLFILAPDFAAKILVDCKELKLLIHLHT